MFGNGGVIKLATLCSGSDNPVVWTVAWIRVCRAEILQVDLDHPRASPAGHYRHMFSCEISVPKQAWIRKNIIPELLFADVSRLGHDKAYCVLSGCLEVVPYADIVTSERIISNYL